MTGTATCATCGLALPEEARFCPSCGTRREDATPWRDPLLGLLVQGRYRVHARLGEGGMSLVYLARHETLGRDVAFKVLRPEVEHEADGVARFAREGKAASRIDHPNVVSVLDFGRAEVGFYYLVMEYVAGRELAAELASRRPWPLPRAAHVLAQIAAAIGRAHELGVVHRDLKPENVLLTQRGGDRDFVKVLDFGLAKPLAEPALTQAGDVFGTPAYMAPEQWRGRSVDARTDVYALGVVAYELLTGRLPFEGATVSELLQQHLREEPRPPSQRRRDPSLPPALDELVLRCLAKDATARPASANEVVTALASVLSAAPGRSRYTSYGLLLPRADARADSQVRGPTLLQPERVDVVWDGPALAEEITRLHALRGRRLAELSEVLWRGSPPPEVATVLDLVTGIEARIDRAGQTIALLRARLDDADREARESEALARVELITAGMAATLLAGMAATLPAVCFAPSAVAPAAPRLAPPLDDAEDEDEVTLSDDADTLLRGGEPDGSALTSPVTVIEDTTSPGTALDAAALPPGADAAAARAERRLSAVRRRWERRRAQLEDEMTLELATLREAEAQVVPLYERLSELVRAAAARRRDLRDALVAFGRIDGALAAYQALLEGIAIE